jgi:hypothetical protein
MAQRRAKAAKETDEDESTDFSFDPGTQRELDAEDVCCITGEELTASFCRFPDWKMGTLLVMSKAVMIESLRNGTTIEKFKEVLAKRHGKKVLDDYYS